MSRWLIEKSRSTEQVNVAILSDDLWYVEKVKSDLQIAGFLRNIFKYSIYRIFSR
ncbi:hypothetical protein PACTADRAFT_77893 [Pachysolen tannophilus NRRL Y-2460]|uniref:Uncharacterized protein n=1 Tax=Pachysolen tannophilus NRRL Y-2460 TaxID=669874 RepID=A0A1E4TMV8_PACTA|nr:hypothetical protein PACTADRAFT_77893 [Pachysolen tannophilus NRRL Y-2460]